MKRFALAAAILLSAAPAMAAGLQFNSAPVFIGQVETQHGIIGLGYYASIMSVGPNAQGYMEIWTNTAVIQSQESYADHLAIQMRAICNKSGDNSCVNGVPGWQETLVQVVSQTQY